jgi:hypothetical protein
VRPIKALENLILAGFDSFSGTLRSQYFHDEGDGITFYEKAIRYGAKFQENENSSQVSLFGKVVMFKLLNRSYHLVRTGALWKNWPKRKR